MLEYTVLAGGKGALPKVNRNAALAVKRRFDFVFAAEATKAAHRNAQCSAGVLVAFVDARDSFDLLFGKSPVHNTSAAIGRCGMVVNLPSYSKLRTCAARALILR